ncbi:MAG: PIG-L deacetylase family protein [Janthinobacterium lividum]
MVSGTERQNWQQQATELTTDDLLKFGSTVIIAPHPDDESLGCGGTIALLRKADLPVHVIFVSDGTLSHPNSKKFPTEKLKALREWEALNALQVLNVPNSNASFMRLKDRSVPTKRDVGFEFTVNRLLERLEVIQPKTILVTWENDPHPDHRASWQIVDQAVSQLNYKPRILQYLIWIWELGKQTDIAENQHTKWFSVNIKSVTQTKQKAVLSHVSQVSRLIDDDPEGFILSPEILAHFDHADELFIEYL